jgi:hypothetical protein
MAENDRWYIIAVRKCTKNGKYCVKLGHDLNKTIGAPVVISQSRYLHLRRRLLGHEKGPNKEMVNASFPCIYNDGKTDLLEFFKKK